MGAGATLANRILIVDDQRAVREGLERTLRGFGYAVATAADAERAVRSALENPPDLCIIDLELPGRHGIDLVIDLQERGVEATLLVLTGHGSIDTALEATRRGVFDYLLKPVRPDQLRTVIERGLERTALRREVLLLRREAMRRGQLGGLVGRSGKMLEIYRLIEQIAPSDASILITGESGVGKEVVAQTIHQVSRRSSKLLVAINCGAIPASLLESEIFGHEKGAFTGANASRAGCFEQAHESTLLLDEIGEMPAELQTKLLRVLEDQRVRHVGGDREIPVDVRVLASTNTDIEEQIQNGGFREDLFFRLNVFRIEIPPLRERPEDIPLLAEHFLQGMVERDGLPIAGFSDSAHECMKQHTWPGNARELRNAVHRAAILAGEGEIQPAHLPEPVRPGIRTVSGNHSDHLVVPLGSSIEEAEKKLIQATLRMCRGNKTRSARVLGISLKTLYTRLHKYSESEDVDDVDAHSGQYG